MGELVILAAVGGLALHVQPALADSLSFDPVTTMNGATQDRAAPTSFGTTTFNGTSVYQESYGTGNPSDWYSYQGMKNAITWSSPQLQTYSIAMYVPTAWNSQDVNAGVWFTSNDLATNITYDGNNSSILAYRSGVDAAGGSGFYIWYDPTNSWQLVDSLTANNQWYNLTFQFNQTTQTMDYFVNNVSVGSQYRTAFGANADVYGLSTLILDSKDYPGAGYTVDYASPVPLPSAAGMGLLTLGIFGVLGAAGLRRRKLCRA